MKGRLAWALILSFVFIPILASAQSELRIARPVDGATVRETVNVLVPAASVPDGGFISCLVDGNFKCADAIKSEDGRYFVYRWSTKAIEYSPETPWIMAWESLPSAIFPLGMRTMHLIPAFAA